MKKIILDTDKENNELLVIKEQLKEQTELLREEIELLKSINKQS